MNPWGPGPGQAGLLALARKYMIRYGGAFSPPVVARAAGAILYGLDGREYLDFTSGQLCATLGHNHPRVVAAIEASCRAALHLDSRILAPPVVLLAQRLCELCPAPLRKAVLLTTGSESVEMGLKLAKKYTGRFEVVGIARSFHGLTGGAHSSTYAYRRRGYGPTLAGTYAIPAPYSYRCPVGACVGQCTLACLTAGFELVDAQTVGAPAAFVAEPILSSGGMIEPPPGYFQAVQRLCRERGMLLILDEAQTGLGRVGAMFAFLQDGIVPDILALSKTLGGGVPIAATLTSRAIEAGVVRNGFHHLTSHVSDPLPAAAALAVLDVLGEEGLVDAAAKKGARLKAGLLDLMARHELIGDVRGRGLLLGVEFVKDREGKVPAEVEGDAVTRWCRRRGLLLHAMRYPGRGFIWRVAPPLTVTDAEIDRALEIIEGALRAAPGGRPVRAPRRSGGGPRPGRRKPGGA